MNITLEFSLNKVGLPLIVTSSKPNLCFLIDTGATHNIVFSYVYKELRNVFYPTQESTKMMGIDGSLKQTQQVTCTLEFEGKEVNSVFSVLDANNAISKIQLESGIQIHGILGIPFLIQNEWILDFKQLTITK